MSKRPQPTHSFLSKRPHIATSSSDAIIDSEVVAVETRNDYSEAFP